jgi:hypothetical protein
MNDCTTVQEWLPWYVSGRLTPSKIKRMSAHIAQCEACRRALADIIAMKLSYVEVAEQADVPIDRVWNSLERELGGLPRARIDVGSLLVGLHIGISAGDRRSTVKGNLNVLGRKVRIIGRGRKGA